MAENKFEKPEKQEYTPNIEARENPLDDFEFKDTKELEKTEEHLSQMFENARGETKTEKSVNISEKNQLNELIEIAFSDSPEKAIKEAQKFKSPYLLDQFHDALVKELRRRNINLN